MADTTKSYNPKEWVEGEIIYSTDLNHMEQGILNQMVGPTGPIGATGARGPVGQAGVQGPVGATGPANTKGIASFNIGLLPDGTYVSARITLQDGTVLTPTVSRVNPAIPNYISISQVAANSVSITLTENQNVSTYLWSFSTSSTETTPVLANSTHFTKGANSQNSNVFTVNATLPVHTVGQASRAQTSFVTKF